MALNYWINWIIFACVDLFVTKKYQKMTNNYQNFPITWFSGIPQSYWSITILKYIDCYLFLMEVVSKKKGLKSVNCLLLWSRFLRPVILKSGGLLNFTPAVSAERPPCCVCVLVSFTQTLSHRSMLRPAAWMCYSLTLSRYYLCSSLFLGLFLVVDSGSCNFPIEWR